MNILPTISKEYEMVMSDHLTDFLKNIVHAFLILCAFIIGHGFQITLFILLEDWKTVLNNKKKMPYVADIYLSGSFESF